MYEIIKEIQLVTRAYCELKGIPVPERYQSLTPEEIAPVKKRVAEQIAQWGALERLQWKKP